MQQKLICYDMRKLVPRFSSDDPWNMAYVKQIEGTHYSFFMSSDVCGMFDNKMSLKKASNNGFLFAYANVGAVHLLGRVADELNKNSNEDLTEILSRIILESK